MTGPVSTGRFAMLTSGLPRAVARRVTRGLGLLVCLALAAPAVGQPPPPAEMEAAHQVQRDTGERDWKLDPAVFIELSPVTAAEPAVRLPDDQRDDLGSASAVEPD